MSTGELHELVTHPTGRTSSASAGTAGIRRDRRLKFYEARDTLCWEMSIAFSDSTESQ
jgi:hypothetical protein